MQPLTRMGSASQAYLVLLISMFAMFSAFISGWFYMIHKCIESSDKDIKDPAERAEMSLNLLKEFVPGVGKFFPKMTIGVTLYTALSAGLLYLLWINGQNFIETSDNLSIQVIADAFSSNEKALAFVQSLSDSDRLIIQKWNLMILIATSIFSYLTMFWPVAIIVKDENPFKAFVTGLITIAKRPFVCAGIFAAFYFSSMLLAIFNSIAGTNFLVQLIGLLVSILLTVYFLVVIFLYFEKYSESNSSSWTDSFR